MLMIIGEFGGTHLIIRHNHLILHHLLTQILGDVLKWRRRSVFNLPFNFYHPDFTAGIFFFASSKKIWIEGLEFLNIPFILARSLKSILWKITKCYSGQFGYTNVMFLRKIGSRIYSYSLRHPANKPILPWVVAFKIFPGPLFKFKKLLLLIFMHLYYK
jgi:hypothetical protein